MAEFSKISGALPAKLCNEISGAIHAALEKGMEMDEACCLAIAVIADYVRGEYGPGYLADLSDVLVARALAPMPEEISHG